MDPIMTILDSEYRCTARERVETDRRNRVHGFLMVAAWVGLLAVIIVSVIHHNAI